MKNFRLLSIAVFFIFAALADADEKPNFVFIIADDCTFRDIGCYGGQAHTPRIDALAREGMRFTRCFQAAPMCSPTRHNIYTGLYPVKSGAYPNHTFAQPGTKSVVHYLKPLGYRIALSGKKHIAPKTVFPFEYSGNNNPNMTAVETLFAESAQAGTPFCLFACSNEPHSPYNKGDASRYPPEKVILPPYFVDTPETRQDMSAYLAEITYFDGQVGQILDLLEKHHLTENTLVVVVSEQGSGFPFAKWTCYDSGLQSACIIRWPNVVKPGAESDALIEYVDMLPTFIDAAGGRPVKALEGKSLVPVLAGQTDQHKEFAFGIMTTRGIINGSDHYGIRSVRSKRYKYIRNLTPDEAFQNVAMKGGVFKSWVARAKAGDADAADKVRRYQHRPAEEFYDLSNDPLEWKNRADDPALAKELQRHREALDAWMLQQGDRGAATEMEALKHKANALKRKQKK